MAAPKPLSLSDVFERYREDAPPHLEQTTRRMQEIHFRRLLEVFPSKAVESFDRTTAQDYVSRRSKQLYRREEKGTERERKRGRREEKGTERISGERKRGRSELVSMLCLTVSESDTYNLF